MHVSGTSSARRLTILIAVLTFLTGVAVPARAQNAPGVSDKEILIGSCAALEGPSSGFGRQTVIGAKAYFALANAGGGVHGRSLKLISSDDSYDPDKTQACFDRLMA